MFVAYCFVCDCVYCLLSAVYLLLILCVICCVVVVVNIYVFVISCFTITIMKSLYKSLCLYKSLLSNKSIRSVFKMFVFVFAAYTLAI